MRQPKSLVATFHLPDVRLHVYLNFEYKKRTEELVGDLSTIDRILGQVSDMPPELQEMLDKFLKFLKDEVQEREG